MQRRRGQYKEVGGEGECDIKKEAYMYRGKGWCIEGESGILRKNRVYRKRVWYKDRESNALRE